MRPTIIGELGQTPAYQPGAQDRKRGLYMSNRIYIFDTTLRDGEQSPGCSMTVPEKLQMAAKLADLGVDIMEAGFPIASDGDFEAVDAVSRQFPWMQVAALARSNKLDVERAAQSLKHAKRPRIHTFIATSDIHLKYKLKKSRQQVLDEAVAAVALAREHTDDVEFSAEDATRTDWDYLEQICHAVVAAGARTVNLPDTVGYSIPEEYAALIGRMVRALGNSAIVSVHCHDDLPYETKIVTEHIYSTSQLLAQTITFGPQPNKAIVGENAFSHEAGIHQDGYLKERTTYEIIDPHLVGVPETKLVLGKHSGRHALHKRAEDLGFDLNKEELNVLYHQFTALADRKKGLRNEEIVAMINQVMGQAAAAAND